MELAIAIAANLVIGAILLALFAWHRAPDSVRLSGPDEALALCARHFPDRVASVMVASDGLTALISLLDESKIGLIHRHGRRWTARELLPEDLRAVTVNGDTIALSLTDFGWPRSQICISDPEVRRSWFSRLQEFAGKSSNEHSTVTPHA
jgi:hypothetical protein